jgi:hypothetical protein
MAAGPCLNPNCSSKGQPHPNCKCYGGMAKGGVAISACAAGKEHQPGCQYKKMAEGGKAFKLDFKGFQHLKSDDKSTTLKHPAGHTITLYHNVLSKPNREALQALSNTGDETATSDQKEEAASPYGKVIKKFASGGTAMSNDTGGDSGDDSTDQSSPQSPVQIFVGGQGQGPQNVTPQPVPTPTPGSYDTSPGVMDRVGNAVKAFGSNPSPMPSGPSPMAPAPKAEEPAPQPASTPPSTPPPSAPPVKSPAMQQGETDQIPWPDQNQPMQALPPLEQHKQQIASDLMKEANNYQNDLANGYITPKDYSNVHGKDSLNKIGTIFALALGGIGSGLTHQPNAALEMMNKELDRDFQAQQKNQEYGLAKTNQDLFRKKQEADIHRLGVENGWTGAQTQQAIIKNQTEQYGLDRMKHNSDAYDQQAKVVANMAPNDPKLPAAKQLLSAMYMGMQNQNANIATNAAGMSAMMGTPGSSNGSGDMAMSTFGGPAGKAMVDYNHAHSMPGFPEVEGQTNQGRVIPDDKRRELEAMQMVNNKGKDLQDYIRKNKGSWSPAKRNIAAQKADEMRNFYNGSIEGGALTKGRMDWYDEQIAKQPLSIVDNALGKNSRLDEIINSNSQRQNQALKDLGFNPQQPDTTKTMNGVQYKKVQGGWQKVK